MRVVSAWFPIVQWRGHHLDLTTYVITQIIPPDLTLALTLFLRTKSWEIFSEHHGCYTIQYMSMLHLLGKCWNVILRIKQCTTKQQMSIPFNKMDYVCICLLHVRVEIRIMAPLIHWLVNIAIGIMNWFKMYKVFSTWVVNCVSKV